MADEREVTEVQGRTSAPTSRRLLDLFSCAGGAAEGYRRAGFEVVGVDIEPQPNYPFEHHVADAVAVLSALLAGETWQGYTLADFDVIHASPPCQRYSAAAEIHDSSEDHPDLVPVVRDLLNATGLPWVMENVERSPLDGFTLCGSSFGLGVKRHRLFESNVFILAAPCSSHRKWFASVFGGRAVGRQRVTGAAGGSGQRTQTWDKFEDELATASEAMGIDWMTLKELSEAIPPAYTQFIGEALMVHLDHLDQTKEAASA